MALIEKTVFLSYRRTNISWALAIFQDLTYHGYDTFLDFTSIASGDFERDILENITSRAHFLVLLTPSALERCGDPTDWLRREIETALDNHRNIVPLILEGFDFDTPQIASQLTGKLAAIKRYNALRIVPEDFFENIERLRGKYLNVPLAVVPHPPSLAAQTAATEQKAAAIEAPPVQQVELTAEQWFERGFVAADPDERLRLYTEALRLKPDYAEAFYNRGNARRAKSDLDGALADYNEALRLKPDFAMAINNRGIVREAKGDLDRALADYNEALRLKPDYAEAINNRGIVRKAKGDLDGALADYNEALRLNPDDAEVLNNRSDAREAKGDFDGALADLNEALRLKPDFAEAFNNRGIVCEAKGDLDRALADYNEALRLKPDYAEAFNNRGIVREAKGDLDGTLADYNEALRLKPDYAEAFNNRGTVRKAKGDLDGALADYSEALRLKPDFATALHNIDIMRHSVAGRFRSLMRSLRFSNN
ncbi:MAG: tetratricopeptide repeat protein [Deltaproteobacteria bacterium]|nr:tetratricopeptide repeat protein [Deltaproteobacteria bacterium]